MEYCELGSLHSFLRSSKYKNRGGWNERQRILEDGHAQQGGSRNLTIRDLFSLAWQIAKGMDYLAGLKVWSVYWLISKLFTNVEHNAFLGN